MHDHPLDPHRAPHPPPGFRAFAVLGGACGAAAFGALLSLVSCEADTRASEQWGGHCPEGTRAECITPRLGDCIGIVPILPPGRRCAGGQIAQCVILRADCFDDVDCGDYVCDRGADAAIGRCVPPGSLPPGASRWQPPRTSGWLLVTAQPKDARGVSVAGLGDAISHGVER